jgi:transposase InsO family protein
MPPGTTLFAYIEGFSNRKRLHSALIGYVTPEQAERQTA